MMRACADWREPVIGCARGRRMGVGAPLACCQLARMWARAVLSGPPDSAMAILASDAMLCVVIMRANSETGDLACGM